MVKFRNKGMAGTRPARTGVVQTLFVLICANHLLYASIINVPQDYGTIQEALNQSNEGDLIHVSPGTYQENLVFPGIGVSLCSLDPTSPTLVQQTIIDGSLEEKPAITLSGNEPTTTTLSGLTITGGRFWGIGGGISGQGSRMTIENNVIEDNLSDFGGGIAQCHGTIQNNLITKNLVFTEGGGVYDCDGMIVNNQIIENEGKQRVNRDAPCYGAGLSRCDGIIEENIIADNFISQLEHQFPDSASYLVTGGGGLAFCSGNIRNNTIRNNVVRGLITNGGSGGGLYHCEGKIIGNIVEQNSTINIGSGGRGGGAYGLLGTVENNIFRYNSSGSGGGVEYHSGSFVNNIVSENHATNIYGGVYRSRCDIHNCIVCGNISDKMYGGLLTSTNTIINSIVWGNYAPEYPQGIFNKSPLYSCVEGWTGGGEGTISVNPLFVDPENGDFRLQPSSSLIDAGKFLGAIGGDFLGNPRPVLSTPEGLRGDGSGYDIGAYEFQGEAMIKTGSQWALY